MTAILAPNDRNSRLTLSPTSSAIVPTAVATVMPSATAARLSNLRLRWRRKEWVTILINMGSEARPISRVQLKTSSADRLLGKHLGGALDRFGRDHQCLAVGMIRGLEPDRIASTHHA